MSNPDTATDQPPAPPRDDGLREYAGEAGGYLGAVYEGLSRITSDPDFGKVISRLGGAAGTAFGAWERAGDAEGITAKDAALGEKCLSSWQIQATCTSGGTPLGECRPIILSDLKRKLSERGASGDLLTAGCPLGFRLSRRASIRACI